MNGYERLPKLELALVAMISPALHISCIAKERRIRIKYRLSICGKNIAFPAKEMVPVNMSLVHLRSSCEFPDTLV